MSVLIKDIDMPKCCAECEWHEYYGGDYDWVHACRRTGTMPLENAETERANNCPLIEVHTPHGRLVDADRLERRTCPLKGVSRLKVCGNCEHKFMNVGEVRTTCDEVRWFFLKTIDAAPTIIEAEE